MTKAFQTNNGGIEAFFRTNTDVRKNLLKTAIQVENKAKRKAPVDTGRLRASIEHEVGTDERGLFARVGTDVEYAGFVEFGTRKMKAQPFLRPALREVLGE